jgi:hypothetical protein
MERGANLGARRHRHCRYHRGRRAVASGTNATYDNRIAQDNWTIAGVISLAGDNAGLRNRIRGHGDALCALGGSVLTQTEWDRPVPTLLVSNDTVLVDQPLPLSEIIAGLAAVELPGHTRQLLALLPDTDGTGHLSGCPP